MWYYNLPNFTEIVRINFINSQLRLGVTYLTGGGWEFYIIVGFNLYVHLFDVWTVPEV